MSDTTSGFGPTRICANPNCARVLIRREGEKSYKFLLRSHCGVACSGKTKTGHRVSDLPGGDIGDERAVRRMSREVEAAHANMPRNAFRLATMADAEYLRRLRAMPILSRRRFAVRSDPAGERGRTSLARETIASTQQEIRVGGFGE